MTFDLDAALIKKLATELGLNIEVHVSPGSPKKLSEMTDRDGLIVRLLQRR